MRIRLKVCCIASVAEARLAIRLGADALGLVGPMPSGPGTLPLSTIAAITPHVPPPVDIFLLTSQMEADAISTEAKMTGARTVQIVSHIALSEIAALRRHTKLRIVQVVHVEDSSSIVLARSYAAYADVLLLDSGRPSLAVPELGGTGRVHDWALSAEIVRSVDKPVFLAGGLTPANVGEAIRIARPFGVDLCSGVRTDNVLDEVKLAAFIRAMAAA